MSMHLCLQHYSVPWFAARRAVLVLFSSLLYGFSPGTHLRTSGNRLRFAGEKWQYMLLAAGAATRPSVSQLGCPGRRPPPRSTYTVCRLSAGAPSTVMLTSNQRVKLVHPYPSAPSLRQCILTSKHQIFATTVFSIKRWFIAANRPKAAPSVVSARSK